MQNRVVKIFFHFPDFLINLLTQNHGLERYLEKEKRKELELAAVRQDSSSGKSATFPSGAGRKSCYWSVGIQTPLILASCSGNVFTEILNIYDNACKTTKIIYKYILGPGSKVKIMASENFKSNLITGLAAGVGATLLAPVLLPLLASLVRPATKAAIKGGVLLYEKGRESFAELSETVDDLVAEAKSEMEAGAAEGAAVAASAAQAATAQGKTAVPSAQSQGSATTSAVQPSPADKTPRSSPAPPTAQANQGGQPNKGAQGRPPTKGE